MSDSAHRRRDVTLSLFAIFVVLGVAAWTRVWVLTALPIGFLFGWLLQKGDLCGASAFSEVVLARDPTKVFGIWVVIVVSMAGFAFIEALGWVHLAPKPMLWISYIVGGAVFGAGTVLAGGCISGCLFKAGAGNLNSMAALVGMPLGIGMVEYGPLNGIHRAMMSHVVKADGGGPVTLSTVTGLPYWLLALTCAAVTLAWVVAARRRRPAIAVQGPERVGRRLLTRPWRPWQAGLAIGLLAVPAYLSSAATGRNYPLGVTHGVFQAYEVLTESHVAHVWRPRPPAPPNQPAGTPPPGPAPAVPAKPINWWLVGVAVSMVPGAWVAARLSGTARLLPRDPAETVTAFLGGILVGAGAAFATGCVVGNILSGWALMSVGLFVFGLVTVLANWVTTYVYLMGGTLDRSMIRTVLFGRKG
jgi:hypothetical protein